MSSGTQRDAVSIATPDYDAVILGAGFAGLYMLHKLRDELGLKVRVYDKAGGVGGTWYWNRYPGARSDSESHLYCYSFDKKLLQDWSWSDRYPLQPEILSYLEKFATERDLHRDIQFNTGIARARFNEATHLWDIGTNQGQTVTAKYCVTALGLLSATNIPNIPGREAFRGEQYHTGAWPATGVDFTGKRVGVIGTGSTGVQVIISVAPQARHLTVFQRTPQYSVPARHGPMNAEGYQAIKADYDGIWDQVRRSAVAFGFDESAVPAMSVSEDERRTVYEAAWQRGGGFRFMFGTFGDIATDEAANQSAAAFIRDKIAQIVKDPETTRKLTPTDLYARRPLCDTGYYDTYNRENVSLVDLKASPIHAITPKGIRTAESEYELDVIIFATGFDAVDGNYTRIDIRGRGGLAIKDKWAKAPTSYLGIANAGYPNLFMVLGPNGPFTNIPPAIEAQVEWISEMIGHAEREKVQAVEVRQEVEDGWTVLCNRIANMTLFPKADSWIFGANIPGKANAVMFYLGGLGNYRNAIGEEAATGYPGFSTEKAIVEGEAAYSMAPG